MVVSVAGFRNRHKVEYEVFKEAFVPRFRLGEPEVFR